jgi:hypothetical protein
MPHCLQKNTQEAPYTIFVINTFGYTSNMSILKLGKYQHYRTKNFYRVIGIAKHSKTLEDLVVYECLYDNPKSKIWARPLGMFLEDVEIDGKIVLRFKFIEE